MAYYTGTMTKTVGALIAILDAKLPLNSYWSIHDAAAGTNCKVYKNNYPGLNSLFYVKVDDNQTDYAKIQLWEGWNEVTHVGVGVSLQTINTYEMRMWKQNGGYSLCLGDLRFIFFEMVNYIQGGYIGQLKRFDVSKNIPVYIGNLTDGSYCALGAYNIGSSAGWCCLFDEGGTTRNLYLLAVNIGHFYAKTIAGTVIVIENPIYNEYTKLWIGQLDGICNYSSMNPLQLNKADLITISGINWIVLRDDYRCCAVRQD